jgi:hypothetical protein
MIMCVCPMTALLQQRGLCCLALRLPQPYRAYPGSVNIRVARSPLPCVDSLGTTALQ